MELSMKVSGLAFVPPGVTTYVRHSAIVMQNGQQVVCEYFLKVFRFELGSSGHVLRDLFYLHGQWVIGVIGAKENFAGADAAKSFQKQRHPADHGGFQEYVL